MFNDAINSNTNIISITSFNEWHEGTQIEPAKSQKSNKVSSFTYESYEKGDEEFYLKKTKENVEKFLNKKKDTK